MVFLMVVASFVVALARVEIIAEVNWHPRTLVAGAFLKKSLIMIEDLLVGMFTLWLTLMFTLRLF